MPYVRFFMLHAPSASYACPGRFMPTGVCCNRSPHRPSQTLSLLRVVPQAKHVTPRSHSSARKQIGSGRPANVQQRDRRATHPVANGDRSRCANQEESMRSTKTRSLTIAVVSDRFGTSIRTGIELPESTTSQIATQSESPAASWTAGRLILLPWCSSSEE